MTTQTEALKLALEAQQAWERSDVTAYYKLKALEPILKEALAQPEQSCPECVFGVCHCKPLAQPEQEPVAFVHGDDLDNLLDDRIAFIQRTKSGHRKTALYTTPPQRTWVGLTDREKSNIWLESRAAIPRFHTYASLVEAKLKEKNNA